MNEFIKKTRFFEILKIMKVIFSESRKKQLFGTEIEKKQKKSKKSGFLPEPDPDRTGPDRNRTSPEPNWGFPNRPPAGISVKPRFLLGARNRHQSEPEPVEPERETEPPEPEPDRTGTEPNGSLILEIPEIWKSTEF